MRDANSAKKRADKPTQKAAITIEIMRAGPAKFAAAVPAVSYTHLDVYKRQSWYILGNG